MLLEAIQCLNSEDIGVRGLMGKSLGPKEALLLMGASKQLNSEIGNHIGNYREFSNAMEVLFCDRDNTLSEIKGECSTFDKALSVWKTSDQNLFTSNIMNWNKFCEVDQVVKLDKGAKKALIKEIQIMTSSTFSTLNLATFNFVNISELNQTDGNGDVIDGESYESDGELYENDVEPQLSVLRDSTSGFGVIRYLAESQYAGFINEEGLPNGEGTIKIYNPDNPGEAILDTNGNWDNGELQEDNQIIKVFVMLENSGVFVGSKNESGQYEGMFYEPNGESKRVRITKLSDNNLSFDYSQ